MERIYCAAIWYKDLPTAKYLPNNIEKGETAEQYYNETYGGQGSPDTTTSPQNNTQNK